MIGKRKIAHPKLKQVFTWFVRRTFHDLKISSNQEMSGYLSDLLAEFSRTDRVFKLLDPQGRPLRTIVELLRFREKARREEPASKEGLELDQHIGDYSLFMTGFFLEFLRRGGFVNLYRHEGRKAYMRVSQDIRFTGLGSSRLFQDLSLDFDRLSSALQYMRNTYIQRPSEAMPTGEFSELVPLPDSSWTRRS